LRFDNRETVYCSRRTYVWLGAAGAAGIEAGEAGADAPIGGIGGICTGFGVEVAGGMVGIGGKTGSGTAGVGAAGSGIGGIAGGGTTGVIGSGVGGVGTELGILGVFGCGIAAGADVCGISMMISP